MRRERQGRGMFHPPPRQPLPGGDSPSTHCHGEDEQIRGLDVNTLPKIPFMLPVHCIRTIANHCPPPLEGAGGGRGAARRVGVALPPTEKGCLIETRATGEGDVPPPPRQPHPHGAISHRYSLFAVSPETPERSGLRPRTRQPGQSPITARPLWRGREEAAERPGRWGWSTPPWKRRLR